MKDIEQLRKEVAELKERINLMEQIQELQKKFDQYKPVTIPMPYPVYPPYPRWNEPWITYTTSDNTWVAK